VRKRIINLLGGLLTLLLVVEARAQDRPEELLGLLPESDLVATIDLGRLVNELQPRLEKSGIPLADEVKQLATRLGIDPRQLKSGVLGLSLQSFEASGLLIIQGVDLERRALEETLKSAGIEYRLVDHQGESIVALVSPVKSPSVGPLSLKTSDLALVSLGGKRLAIGDLSRVRAVIEQRKRSTPAAPTLPIIALRETNPAALLRFAFTLPPGMREEALNQGDLFKSIAGIKVLLGDLDLAPDLAITLNSLLRTPSPAEAAELEVGLKGLLNLGRALLANGNRQVTQILNQVQIRTRGADVNLAATLPPSLLEGMASPAPKKP
jgi:hypothetical protein